MTMFDAAFAVVSDAEFTAEILSALGIDPDMPIETWKRRLLIGERVETYRIDEERELRAESVVGHLVSGEGGVMYTAEALLAQITRPDK